MLKLQRGWVEGLDKDKDYYDTLGLNGTLEGVGMKCKLS